MIVIISFLISVISLYFIARIENKSIKWILSFFSCLLPVVSSVFLAIIGKESFDYSSLLNLIFVYFFVKIIHNIIFIYWLGRNKDILIWIVGWSNIIFYILGIILTMRTHADQEPYFIWLVIVTFVLFIIEFATTFIKRKASLDSESYN